MLFRSVVPIAIGRQWFEKNSNSERYFTHLLKLILLYSLVVPNFHFKYNCLKIFTLIIALTFFADVQSQALREPLAVKYAGLGAYSKSFSDIFSGTANQASLAQLSSAAFGVYGERRFMLDELNNYAAIIAVPTTSGTIGLQADYFGSSDYNENRIGLIYARKLSSKIDAGVKFNYHSIKVAGYGTASTVNFEGGVLFHLTEKLHAGIQIYNPTSSKFNKAGSDKLASEYKFGLGYEASKNVFLSTEIVKQEDKDVGVNVGLQYNVHEKVLLRGGISTIGNNSFLGMGLRLNFGRIDINAAFHPQLGFTPGMLLIINLKKS